MKDGDYMMPKNWIPGYKGKYFATIEGQIFRVYKNGRTRELKGYKKRNVWCVKLTDEQSNTKELMFQRVIWETFKGPIPPGYLVTRKTPLLNKNNLHNLRLRTKEQSGKRTGPKSRSMPVVLVDDDGGIIDSWPSARKAAKDLFVSYQTVMDVCNGKVKKPVISVRWQKESDMGYQRLPGEFANIQYK